MFDHHIEQAAGLLIAAHRSGTRLDALPIACQPATVEEAHAIQDRMIAALGEPAQAVRVRRYQLQSGPAGAHLADMHVELPAGLLQTVSTGAAPGRSYQAASSADPLGEPPPIDPWAGVPAHWRAELARPKLMLETSPLSAYALTGTLERGGEWLALLQGEGMLHTVRVGDPLGPDAGRVLRIAEHGLWLREIVRDSQGRWSDHQRQWRVGEKP